MPDGPDRPLDGRAVADLCRRAAASVDAGDVPSCQIAVGYQGRIMVLETYGAPPESRYVIFSATKPIVASVVWMLLTEGLLELDRPVAEDIPPFAANGKESVTLEHVLLHTAGFPNAPLSPALWNDREARVRRLCEWRLEWPAGTQFAYHATSAHWVLAELIERATGSDFRAVVRDRVLAPLGLHAFVLGADPGDTADVQLVVNSGEPPDSGELERMLGIRELPLGSAGNDHSLLEFNSDDGRRAGVPGAGGVSTAADVALFYQALLHNPGTLWEPRLLADVTGNARNHFIDPMTGDPANRSLGLVIKGDDGKGERRHDFGPTTSPGAFGHSGVGGQIAWADPASGLSFCHLTNGIDRNPLKQARRSYALSKRAAVLGSPAPAGP